MKKNTAKHSHPGRPKYVPVIPRGKFTMIEFCIANGVNPKNGKGKNCSKLTLIKFLKRKEGKALVQKVKDELAEPTSKKGLGRKAFLFQRREGVTMPTPTITLRAKGKSAKAASATPAPKRKYTRKATSTATADYEATKAALLAPAVTITPDPTPAPEATPAPEPVAETAAPAEPVAAEVATTEPASVTA